MAKSGDRFFFYFVIFFTVCGFLVFASAALGLLSRSDGANFQFVTSKQFLVMVAGLLAFMAVSRVPFGFWQKVSPYLFIFALVATWLVFVPGLGLSSGGAKRWLALGQLTIQPSEFLKLGFVLYFAAWLAKLKPANNERAMVWFFFLILGLSALPLVAQPDIDTLLIIFLSGLGMLFAANLSWSKLLIIVLVIGLGAGGLVVSKPYLLTRVQTFLNPTDKLLGAGWQINQSLIAIGSGGLWGRGFGQSIQKFKYLPEPIGDSIFAVAGEEFGFAGATIVVLLFLIFAFSGLRIAARSASPFGRLGVVGIVIMITAGSLMNVAAMLGLIPLTGTPLVFISHGGTALLLALAAAGVVLNVSRAAPRRNASLL